MSDVTEKTSSGHSGAREILVWDRLVRLIHWSLAACILLNGVFTDPEKELHEWVGYVALGLIALRLAWGLIGPQPARLWAFPPNPLAAIRHLRGLFAGDRTVHLTHNPMGALMIWNIWGTVGLLGATGIMMGTIQFFGVKWVGEVHEIAFNWLILSVALHVGGVIFDTRRTGVPLVLAMINGRKRIPEGRSVE